MSVTTLTCADALERPGASGSVATLMRQTVSGGERPGASVSVRERPDAHAMSVDPTLTRDRRDAHVSVGDAHVLVGAGLSVTVNSPWTRTVTVRTVRPGSAGTVGSDRRKFPVRPTVTESPTVCPFTYR